MDANPIIAIVMLLLTFSVMFNIRDYNDLVEDHNKLLGKYYNKTYEVKDLKAEVKNLKVLMKDYRENLSELSEKKDNQESQIDILTTEIKEREKEYNDLLEEYQDFNNFTWTGCKDSRTVIKFCKGCNWNLECSGSMKNTFSCENSLYFCYAKKDEIKIGDIIAFLSPEYENDNYDTFYTIHRVIEINSNGFVTKGDNNLYIDEFIVPYKNIVGKLYKIEGSITQT